MLAKPEYSSPPDEVCCWPGAPMRFVAGRGAVAELHREDAAAVDGNMLPGAGTTYTVPGEKCAIFSLA